MATGFPGFVANMATKLPFGMSDRSNNNPSPSNPNFPSKTQLDPKNLGADPANLQQQNGNNEPDPNNSADSSKEPQGSQLDAFKDIFTLPTDKDGNPIQPTDTLNQPLMAVDPKKVAEAAKSMNFAAGITPEMLQKAMTEPQALLDLLNATARNGFAAALQATTGVVEKSFQTHNQRFDAELPNRIRSTQIKQQQVKHPALAHPAAQPVLESLKNTIAATNPNLPPERVAEMAENYVIAMAGDITNVNTQVANANKPKDPSEVDWSALLSPQR